MEDGPIFIGGPDRCGKTLLRLALSAHPRLALTRRTYLWTYFYRRYGDLARRDNLDRCLAAMLRHRPIAALAPDLNRLRREFRRGEPSYARLFALVHQHYAERVGKPRWGEQSGGIEQEADAIMAAYPDARMIHMLRDPRDRFAAMRRGRADESQIGSATARWRHSARLARRNLQRYPDRYLIVRYEALLNQREATLREICDVLGESFVLAMLTPDRGDAERADRRAGGVAGAPSLSRRELALIESYAGHEMLAYGYRPAALPLTLRDRLMLTLVDWPRSLAQIAVWHGLETLHTLAPAHVARKRVIARA